jgi:hypothetical protein
MMVMTMELAARLMNQDVDNPSPFKSHNAVFGYGKSNLVAVVYREHVVACCKTMSPMEQAAHRTVVTWMRRLETGYTVRVFNKDPSLSPVWWDAKVRQVVSRITGHRRVVLPLGDELSICIKSLQSHYLPWLLNWVDERHMTVTMFPKAILRRVHASLASLSPDEYEAVRAESKRLYKLADGTVKKVDHDNFKQVSFPYYRTAAWPGLRLCPPFFADMNVMVPVPSLALPTHPHLVVLHSYLEAAYAISSEADGRCQIREIKTLSQPHQELVGLELTDFDEERSLNVLQLLDRVHPFTIKAGPSSPYARAAKMILPVHLVSNVVLTTTPSENFVKIPHFAGMEYEVGFSFNTGKALGGMAEAFYEVNAGGHTFYLSSYTGFGLRIRYKLLTLLRSGELRRKSVRIIVPDGLSAYTLENMMRTLVDWLHDLGLTDVKLVSDSVCNKMCLLTSAPHGGSCVSLYDGAFQLHTLEICDNLLTHKFVCQPLLARLFERFQDFVLRHPAIRAFLGKTTEGLVLDQLRGQSQSILKKLDGDFSDLASDVASFKFHQASLQVAREEFHEWVTFALTSYVPRQPWFDQWKQSIEGAQGIVVGGGIFEVCGTLAHRALLSILGPNARLLARKDRRLSTVHGAVVAVYAQKGHGRLWLSDNDSLVIPSLQNTKTTSSAMSA